MRITVHVILFAKPLFTSFSFVVDQDSLGSTSHVADANGQLLEWYRYDLYGKPKYYDASNSQLQSSNYQVKDLHGGARWIPELGLYDDRNRFMSPELGRFLQPDPIGFKGDASNLYRFCGNDWANRTDPTGLEANVTVEASHWSRFEAKLIDLATAKSWLWTGANPGSTVFFGHSVTQGQLANLAQQFSSAWTSGGNFSVGQTSATQNSPKSFEQSAHPALVKMLAEETHKPGVTQTGLITSGEPGRVGPTNERMEAADRFNLGGKRVARERLPAGPKGQESILVHYHHRIGENGRISGADETAIMKRTMYFTNSESAAKGEYFIYRKGNLKPEVHHSDDIIP